MSGKIGYKFGCRIRINNGFYEVSNGKKVCYYGRCEQNSTIEEIANKTILCNYGKGFRKNEMAAVVE